MKLRTLAVAAALGLSTALVPLAASAQAPALTYLPEPGWWGTNGRVMDIAPVGDRIYLGGGFDYVGPTTGYGVGLDPSGHRLAAAPLVDGQVSASVPDGAGGWYIAGEFHHVGGKFRPGAAQVTAAGKVTAWNPKPRGHVYALAVSGDEVVLGGDLATVGRTAVQAAGLGAVDKVNGYAVPGWSASTDRPIRSLVTAGGSLYVGGDFGTVDGQAHQGVARLNAVTGALDPTFTGRAAGSVDALALSPDGGVLYAGGTFTSASGSSGSVARTRLAAYDTISGNPTAWAPGADGAVAALATDPTTGNLYAGGDFSTVGTVPRSRLAGITPAGQVTGFDAQLNGCHIPHVTGDAHSNPTCNTQVMALASDGQSLYVGGRFSRSGSLSRHDAAAFSVSTGALTAWDPVAGNPILTLAPSGGNVFAGGEFTSVNGEPRSGVAALNATTGALDPTFEADTDDEVLALAVSSDQSRLFLAGAFSTVQGVSQPKLASLLLPSGTVDPAFRPVVNDEVLQSEYAQGALYAAGQFTKVNGIRMRHVVKLGALDGSVDRSFRADTTGPSGALRAGGMVQGLAVAPDGSKVYLGGPFTSVNGTALPAGLAVVDGATGALLPRQLGGVQGCGSVGPWMVHLYLSPDGKRLYGGDVCPDSVYQWDAVNLSTPTNPTGLNWWTACNAGMQGALEVNGNFYLGTHGGDKGGRGYCWASPTNHTRVSQQRYFVFDSTSGVLGSDHPSFDTPMGVWSFAVVPQGLLVGGDFTFAGNSSQVQQGVALFPGIP
jgi:hypothetical protein